MTGAPAPDVAEVGRALHALFDDDDVIELRAFAKSRKRTDAGYFDGEHRGDAAEAARRLNGHNAAVYVTLNRLDPQLLGRYANRVQEFAQATATDTHITRRRWLLVDFDPVRPSDTSAAEGQLEAARERSRACYRAMRAEGWPEPIVAESGNGMHLLYPLDLSNDAASRELVKGALAGLAERFDNEAVTVDQSVFNAGRIAKLYGTVANKGDHTEATPWRLSRLVSIPPRDALVTIEHLRALHPAHHTNDHTRRRESFDLEAFLSRLGIEYTHDTHDGSERYKLSRCPFNADHGKGEAAIFRRANGALGFRCQHNGCRDHTWGDVRALVDGPQEARARNAQPGGSGETTRDSANATSRTSIAYRRASHIEARPIHWLWRGRIARGKASIIAGNPGLGKSQITASLAAVVSTAGWWPVDRTRCERGNVVILSAEDEPEDTLRPRLESAGADLDRIYIIDAVRETSADDNVERQLNIRTDLSRLAALLEQIGEVALLVVDPITAYLGDTDSHKNAEIRALLAPLAKLAQAHDAAVVCVSHLTKSGASEAMMRVMGSLAFVAAARGAYLVAKDPENDARRLFLPMKNNIGPDHGGGLAFSIEPTQLDSPRGVVETSIVKWESEAVTMTADEVMSAPKDEIRTERDEAADWLRDMLANGPKFVKELQSEAKDAGISWRTIERAKTTAGVIARKADYSSGWRWMMPDDDQLRHEARRRQNGGGLGGEAHHEANTGAGSDEGRQATTSGGLGGGDGGLGGTNGRDRGSI